LVEIRGNVSRKVTLCGMREKQFLRVDTARGVDGDASILGPGFKSARNIVENAASTEIRGASFGWVEADLLCFEVALLVTVFVDQALKGLESLVGTLLVC
jgi:hypothetical protein